MSEEYICDNCDKRIDSGYTVFYGEGLSQSVHGLGFRTTAHTRNFCHECFPTENKSRVTALLEALRAVLTGTGGDA